MDQKNESINLQICSPSGCGKSFHGCGLTSALVTRTPIGTGHQNVHRHWSPEHPSALVTRTSISTGHQNVHRYWSPEHPSPLVTRTSIGTGHQNIHRHWSPERPSALVTRTSMRVSPPVPLCMAS